MLSVQTFLQCYNILRDEDMGVSCSSWRIFRKVGLIKIRINNDCINIKYGSI